MLSTDLSLHAESTPTVNAPSHANTRLPDTPDVASILAIFSPVSPAPRQRQGRSFF